MEIVYKSIKLLSLRYESVTELGMKTTIALRDGTKREVNLYLIRVLKEQFRTVATV